jgi:AcrR family transcriptional regulator
MSARAKQDREKDLRQEIIDAAREIFVAEGYDRLSMRRVAEKIGYSPTTIYLYFEDKAHLLRDVCEEAFQKLGEAIAAARETGTEPLDVLKKGLFAYIYFGIANPHQYEVAFVSPKEKIFHSGDFSFKGSAGERAFSMLSSSVIDCINAGIFRRGDAAKISQTIWASIHGVTSLLIMHEKFPFVDRDDLIESVIETTVGGLKA